MKNIDEIKNMSKVAVLRELAKYAKPKELKATYVKTVKPDEIFEKQEVAPTTEVHRIKYMGKDVYIPIIKEKEGREGALDEKFIDKVLSKVSNPKSKELVKKYLEQEKILDMEEGRYLKSMTNIPVVKDEKINRTNITDIVVHPSFVDKNKKLSLEEIQREIEKQPEKQPEKEIEEMTIEELKPKAKEANRIINELKKRLLIPIVDAEVKRTVEENPDIDAKGARRAIEKALDEAVDNIKIDTEKPESAIKEQIQKVAKKTVDEIRQARIKGLEKARAKTQERMEKERPERERKEMEKKENQRKNAMMREVRKKIREANDDDDELAQIYNSEEFKVLKDREERDISKDDKKLIRKVTESKLKMKKAEPKEEEEEVEEEVELKPTKKQAKKTKGKKK